MNIHPHSIEPLEARIAPAGVVTATYIEATGELTLTGDAVANDVSLFQTGTNTYRIEGSGTDIDVVGTTFKDIGKLTKLTITGGDGSDSFSLLNLRTLTSLSFSGGIGDDTLGADNITVSGATEIHGNAGSDNVTFNGISTLLNGTLTVDSAAAATDQIVVDFDAQTTVVGGIVTFTGGGGSSDELGAFGEGAATFSKGIIFNPGAGGGDLNLDNDGALSVGKLVTGESILYTGGDGADGLDVAGLGTATLAGGIRMTGGGDDDSIEFFEDATTLKIGKLATGQSILFDGGAGNDSISFSTVFNANLSGGIEFSAADGDNFIEFLSTGGTQKIGKLATGESVKFTGTTGSDSFSSSSTNQSFSGGIIMDAGAGSNSLDILGLGGKASVGKTPTGVSLGLTGLTGADSISTDVASLSLSGGVILNGDAGTNQIDINNTGGKASIGKDATGISLGLTGLAGSDSISTNVADLTLSGGIVLAGGDGTNRVDVLGTSAKATIGKTANGQSIFYTGTAGNDTVNTTVTNLTLQAGIEFVGGDGSNNITLTSPQGTVKIGTLATKQSILFTGGTGGDNINTDLGHVTLSGGVQLDGGSAGSNRLEFDDNGFVSIGKFGTGQSIVFTGTGTSDNEMDLGGIVTVAGSVSVVGGSGSDDIDFDGKVTVGKDAAGLSVSMIGNDGDDDIDFNDNITLAGSLKHDGGNDNDELDFNGPDTLTIKGPVEFTGGTGNDFFDINVFSLALGSTVTFTGVDGDDDFTMTADGSVVGDVTVDLGGAAAGSQVTTVTSKTQLPGGLSLKGALALTASGAVTTDFLTIRNVAVAKLINLTLGEGVSTVNIDNLNAGDEFKLDTRGGSDIVNIERGNFFGGSLIKKLATIQLGLGDDQLLIGNPLPLVVAPFPDHTRVNFLGGLSADAGAAGNDNRNDIVGQNDGVLIAGLIGFELNTLV